MANDKVFGSHITRTHNKLNNNLYDILIVNPVTPLPLNDSKNVSCDFVPKTGKYFIPKRKLRPKVKTVRDIRNIFEKDVNSDLSVYIEKQQNVLLRKIKSGSSKDEKTKLFARNLLKSEKPISRTAWQMIININPDNFPHSSQYVLSNGKCILVNGSRGGKSKFIYKYDLGERRASLIQRYKFKVSNLIMKKNLLKDSLNVKFKPGPLSKKKQLDISYQKYNIGKVELVDLPKPGLDILPEYGKPIETSVANFLHNLRDTNGVISDKWAEFATTVLGTNQDGCAVQLNKENYVTFDLGYVYDQRRLLMRYDGDNTNVPLKKETFPNICKETEEAMQQQIQNILDEILISVEVNLLQNNMYTGEDTPRELDAGDFNNSFDSQSKDKVKRKGQSELNRLDITVIRLCDGQEKKEIDSCRKSFCTLGCICDSLTSSYHLKNHCGHIECMFKCKCDFYKYNLQSYLEDDIIPGLVKLDKENNSKLSKEEQKFHQTVILSGEKSILWKSQRRNWKAPEKYAEFYSNMCLKTSKDIKKILSVVEVKLNCGNIEPWCMVHNLYKCFCKGKFTEKLSSTVPSDETISEQNDTNLCSPEKLETNLPHKINEPNNKNILKTPSLHKDDNVIPTTDPFVDKSDPLNYSYKQCARVKAYRKRKYTDDFYFNTNKKIMELEQNDQGLQKRMKEILNIDENDDTEKPKNDLSDYPTVDLSSSPTRGQINEENEVLDKPKTEIHSKLPSSSTHTKLTGDIITTQFTSPTDRLLNNKLKAWLEPSLKLYRQRFGKGFFKKSMEPPKAGKIALYPWDFIINRYHEKKNLFFVTIQKPFRIFMAVDNRNALFNNCIDIRTIEDFDKYPINVKNIINKNIDILTDQLCILRGLNFCWELVGSVKKVCDRKNSDSDNNTNDISSKSVSQTPQHSTIFTNSTDTPVSDTSLSVSLEKNTEQSKWFVMTIGNDFSEIQFYNKGFFVKYDSIIKAINVARLSRKTVRLSSQKCSEGSSDPQFGIYAIPNVNEYCVFIGPYERNQSLGIETVKNTLPTVQLKTRGVWITTNKVDNLRVIDDPLSFMSQINLENGQVLDESSQDDLIIDTISSTDIRGVTKPKEGNKVVKLVKPITITKTNNFYHLTPSGFLKPIAVSPENQTSNVTSVIKNHSPHDVDSSTANSSILRRTFIPQIHENKYLCIQKYQKQSSNRPIAEIAPQVKVMEESHQSKNTPQKIPSRKFEGGMFILKPEEINSRSLVSKLCHTSSPEEKNTSTAINRDIDMDIENFLANSVKCSAPTSDVYVISDDEDYCKIETLNKSNWKDVWIICNSVKKMGWISGRQNTYGHLSFEFPGFKFTEFYPEEEAFAKITQVLARKVYIPEHVKLSWSIVKTRKELRKLKKLKQEDLDPNYVLTKKGLIHKTLVAEHFKKEIKTYSKNGSTSTNTSAHDIKEVRPELEVVKKNIDEMDTKSNILLKEGEQLLSETVLKKEELCDSFSKMSNDRRQSISDRLRSIISDANSC